MRSVLALATLLAIAGSAPAQARITVPRGVHVGTVARGVGQPTNIAFDARGRIWTTSAGYVNAGSDGVWVTPRAGARPRHVIRRLYTALGLAWFRGELYVSYVTPYSDRIDPVHRRGRIDAFSRFDGRRFHRRRTVLRNLPVGAHNVDSIAVGPHGRLFAGIGAPTNAQRPRARLSATVISFLPNGHSVRVEGRGFRNPYGLAFVPGGSQLLVSENSRDDLGPFRPPDELNVVDPQGPPRAFGFPGCFDQGGRACAHSVAPLARLAPHASADGLAVARRFGRYGLSAFIAENGSSFAQNRTGSDVVRVALRRRGRHLSAHPTVFARGFREHDPLGAAMGPGGALYVTLFGSGRVLRFTAR